MKGPWHFASSQKNLGKNNPRSQLLVNPVVIPKTMVKSLFLTWILETPKLIDFACLYSSEQDTKWDIYSSCSMHMTGEKDFLRDLKLTPKAGYINYGNNTNS